MQKGCLTREDWNNVDHAHLVTSTRSWPLLQIRPKFVPSVRTFNSDSLAGICMKQASGVGGAWDPIPDVLPGAATHPHASALQRAHYPPPASALFFGYTKKPIFGHQKLSKWEFPREFSQEVQSKSGNTQRLHLQLTIGHYWTDHEFILSWSLSVQTVLSYVNRSGVHSRAGRQWE